MSRLITIPCVLNLLIQAFLLFPPFSGSLSFLCVFGCWTHRIFRGVKIASHSICLMHLIQRAFFFFFQFLLINIQAVSSGAYVLGMNCPRTRFDIRACFSRSFFCLVLRRAAVLPWVPVQVVRLVHLLSTNRPALKSECRCYAVASYYFSFTSVVLSATSKCKSFHFILKGFCVRTHAIWLSVFHFSYLGIKLPRWCQS